MKLFKLNFSIKSLLSFFLIFSLALSISPSVASAATTYDFDSDTVGQAPSNVTVVSGTFQVANNVTLGQSLNATSKTGEIAGALFDSFPSTADMSVTWKGAYTANNGADGFILRAQSASTSYAGHAGARLGYLFQLNGANTAYIFKVTDAGFSVLGSWALAKVSPRYFRASAVGTTLTFDYSSDGSSFTNIGSATDNTYNAGLVEYTAGYGVAVGMDYVDNITLTNLSLALSGSNSFTGTSNVAMPITDLQVVGGASVVTPVKLFVTSGSLAMSTTTGLTFNGPSTGSTIYFSGTIANINAALSTLTYTRSGTGSDTLEVSLVNSGEVFFPTNGHLYKFISGTTTWNSAQTAATSQTAYNTNGYLATITSQSENDFISARMVADGWIGASDSATEGDWKWVTGPEAGTSFWLGAGAGHTVNGGYANWNNSEPNDSGANEDCAEYYSGSGKWNDLPCSGNTLTGYVAEFGTPSALPTVVAKNISITTAAFPTVNSFSPADDAVNINPSTNLVLNFSQSVSVGTGNILIKKTSDDSTVETIPVGGAAVTGGGTSTITIDPVSNLQDSTAYYMIIPNTAFYNAGNAYYAGIATSTIWNFTTGDYTAPTIVSVSSSTPDGYYKAGTTITALVTFSEPVTSTGVVTLTFDTLRTCTVAISNATTGSCVYTVQSGDTSADLNATVSGVIRDQSTNTNLLVNFTPGILLSQTSALVVDTTAPVLSTVTNVPSVINTLSARYYFSTTEDGTYTVTSCGPNAQTTVTPGVSISIDNLINRMAYTCTFTVTDLALNISNALTIGTFTVFIPSGHPMPAAPVTAIVRNTVVTPTAPSTEGSTNQNNTAAAPHLFLINMKEGSSISDVALLQEFLKSQGKEIYPEAMVNGYFGKATKRAVIRFQEKYFDAILLPLGNKKGTGLVYEYTRKKINEIILNQK